MSVFLKKINIFALTYGIICKTRRFLYQKKIFESVHFEKAVTISVGNLSMGGTGKTPHTEFLIRKLSGKFKTAVLSRGYGRKTKGFISITANGSPCSAETIGDEPLQMHRKFPDVEIAVCEKRTVGIEKMLASPNPPELIILDDAFQHLHVEPDCHLLLTEYARPYFNDFVVPAGRLREFPSAARFADIIIVTKTPEDLAEADRDSFIAKIKPEKHQEIFFSTIKYLPPVAANELAQQTPLTPETPVILVTGIANPAPLLKHISQSFKNVKHFQFGDHHNFSEKEINEIFSYKFENNASEQVILTTEKDISRLITDKTKKIISLQPVFAIPIEMQILYEEENKLINKIEKICYKKLKKAQIS